MKSKPSKERTNWMDLWNQKKRESLPEETPEKSNPKAKKHKTFRKKSLRMKTNPKSKVQANKSRTKTKMTTIVIFEVR